MVTWLTVGHLISLEKATGTQLLATALATKMLQVPYLPKRCYHLKFGSNIIERKLHLKNLKS